MSIPFSGGESNLLALYHLENANDAKGSYNLSNQGSVSFSDGGKFGKYASFNGSSQALYNDSFYNLNGNFTIICWLKDIGTSGRLIEEGKAGVDFGNFYIAPSASNKISFSLNYANGSSHTVTSNNATSSTWSMWAFVRDGSYGKIYYNGQFDNQTEHTQAQNGSTYFAIGATRAAPFISYCSGKIDEVAIFSDAKSADFIKSYYDTKPCGGAFLLNMV